MLKDIQDLDTLINQSPEGSVASGREYAVIAVLDGLGKAIGYGALMQLAYFLKEVQCYHNPDGVAALKRNRFGALNWPLPDNYDEIQRKARSLDGS